MNINSTKNKVTKDQEFCYNFLSKPENYKQLMPEHNEKFELNNVGGFNFQLKGMPEINLKLEEETPNNEVVWASANDKFDFSLKVTMEELNSKETEVQFLFHGAFNAMMAMMVKNPLSKFINILSANVKGI